ncbi:hypothetical protein H5410_014967 [Solanum commersonii]|uniref:Uncharacterized protein n=1 Tax=Solanum commersonii TaxID=4109 RepID=A0A9J5ZT14_SOLCO|nr:hypothetical protein H5410_014967 [Solanum commersonii]
MEDSGGKYKEERYLNFVQTMDQHSEDTPQESSNLAIHNHAYRYIDEVLAVPIAAFNKLLVWIFRCFPSSPSSSGIFESSDGLSFALLVCFAFAKGALGC